MGYQRRVHGECWTDAMPTAGASWIQECGAVAASLSLSSLFPHSPQDHQECHHLPVSPGTESPASHNTNLATIMEDENNVGTSIGNKENSGYSEENNAEEYRQLDLPCLQHIPRAVPSDGRGVGPGGLRLSPDLRQHLHGRGVRRQDH